MDLDENFMILVVCTFVFLSISSLTFIFLNMQKDIFSSDAVNTFGYFKIFTLLNPLVRVLGKCLLPTMSWTHRERVRKKLNQTGYEGTPVEHYFALQICLSLIFMLFSFGLILIFDLNATAMVLPFFLISVLGGFLIPSRRLMMLHRKRCLEIKQGWPFFLDLLMISLHSGMGLESALRMTMSVMGEGAIKNEWSHFFHALKMGRSKSTTYAAMESRLNIQMVSTFISMVSFSEKSGSSLLRQLEQQSIKLRSDQYISAEENAQRLPFKMMFPLAICFFPCTFMVISYPVVKQLLSVLK